MTPLLRRLHACPEPAGQEEETARLVASFLEDHGLDVETGIGGHGVLARMGAGRRLLRADLDALPGPAGAKHLCGHDGHAAMLAEAMADLAARDGGIDVAALFQPSEEDGAGMARCLGDPRVASLPVQAAFAIHNLPGTSLGTVVLGPGALASSGVRVRLQGRPAHAAHPQEGLSPYPLMRAGADAVAGLADRVAAGPDTAGHADALDPYAQATLIHARLGDEAYGTSPGDAVVCATLRGSDAAVDSMRKLWLQRVRAAAGGVAVEVDDVDPFPATRNTPDGIDMAQRAAQAAGLAVERRDAPFAWSEDFGHALAKWGGALVGLGAGVDHPPLHDARYRFPEALVEPGVRFWIALAEAP